MKLFLILLAPLIFLVASIFTLSDYGINWDSPKHFIRGQSYLHFILSGKRNFLDVPAYPALKGAPDFADLNVGEVTSSGYVTKTEVKNSDVRRSYFQSDFYTFAYFMTKHVHTHPEVNGLFVAFTNYIFFQKLGVVGDIESYHLFIVMVTFAMAIAVALYTYKKFGVFASIVSTVSLVFYPLVFSESHFNIKDPVLMSFFGLSILTFGHGFSKNKPIYVFMSSIFAGFALGTKFNTFFLVPILAPWLLFVLISRYKMYKERLNLIKLVGGRKMAFALLVFPFISLGILYIFSPYLWIDPSGHFMEIVNYYKRIGTEPLALEMSSFLVYGWNTYPIVWILYTTPLPILFLFTVGFLYSVYLIFRKKEDFALLILLWFAVPIIRVMWSGTNIYGGVRQIMEFIPAMAMLSGMGAYFLISLVKKIFPGLLWISKIVRLLILLSFLFVVYELVIIHPNENVYFNQLIGGLRGAKESSIPSWGNTYGNVYLQGIEWLNEHVEENAKLALPVNYISSIPRLKLRNDINLDNHHFSGINIEGEYAIEMDYDWPLKSRYKYSYYDTFLNPVYQVKVDGVPLLKIWKNDLQHTKPGFKKEVLIKPVNINVEGQKLKVDFANQVLLTRLVVEHSTDNCDNQFGDGFIAVSIDNQNWVREPEPLVDLESPEFTPGTDEDTFIHLFPARSARSIILNTMNLRSCILKYQDVIVMGLLK